MLVTCIYFRGVYWETCSRHWTKRRKSAHGRTLGHHLRIRGARLGVTLGHGGLVRLLGLTVVRHISNCHVLRLGPARLVRVGSVVRCVLRSGIEALRIVTSLLASLTAPPHIGLFLARDRTGSGHAICVLGFWALLAREYPQCLDNHSPGVDSPVFSELPKIRSRALL